MEEFCAHFILPTAGLHPETVTPLTQPTQLIAFVTSATLRKPYAATTKQASE